MEEEIWLPIKDYENYYISNLGRVKNIDYRNSNKETFRKIWGNNEIQLSNHGKRKTFKVHKLVAEYFVDNPNNYHTVDFLDGDISNCRADNLKWVKKRTIAPIIKQQTIEKQLLWEKRRKILKRIDQEVFTELYKDNFRVIDYLY